MNGEKCITQIPYPNAQSMFLENITEKLEKQTGDIITKNYDLFLGIKLEAFSKKRFKAIFCKAFFRNDEARFACHDRQSWHSPI